VTARAACARRYADRAAGAQAGPALRRRRAQHHHSRRARHQDRPRRALKLPRHAESRRHAAPARARHLRRRAEGAPWRGHQALQQRLQEARWFIKNIQQRFDTILRVSNAIVERQRNYFVHGELAMRPLVLREIADELGLHESTISRVTTAKYMSTPFGTVELKYFFGSALGTETGGNASSTAVRALIKQFVSAESIKKPLSDSQISEMLKEQGIECAQPHRGQVPRSAEHRPRKPTQGPVESRR
jgi:AraC-like DNA-binding protein